MHGIVDIHCHILPGVDDGARTGRIAVHMLREERRQGVSKIILTPHFRGGLFETEPDVIKQRFRKLCEVNERLDTGIELYLGCEYHCASNMAEDFEKGIRPTLAGSRYVLLEFSHRDGYAKIRQAVYDLVIKDFVPVIAHVERYPALMKNLDAVDELMRLGAKFQVTAGAVYGAHGFRYKQICKKLISEEFVHFIATDAHDMKKRIPDMGQCVRYIEKKKGPAYAKEIFVHNPGMILAEGNIRNE